MTPFTIRIQARALQRTAKRFLSIKKLRMLHTLDVSRRYLHPDDREVCQNVEDFTKPDEPH
eukprot:1806825-Rhodomonas_salina.1